MGRGARGTRWRRLYCDTEGGVPAAGAAPEGAGTAPAAGLPRTRTPNGEDSSRSPESLMTMPTTPSPGAPSEPDEGTPRGFSVTKCPGRSRSSGPGSERRVGKNGASQGVLAPSVWPVLSHRTVADVPVRVARTPGSPGTQYAASWAEPAEPATSVTRSPTAKVRPAAAPPAPPAAALHRGKLAQHVRQRPQATQPASDCPQPQGSPGDSLPSKYSQSASAVQAPQDAHTRAAPGEKMCAAAELEFGVGDDDDAAAAVGASAAPAQQERFRSASPRWDMCSASDASTAAVAVRDEGMAFALPPIACGSAQVRAPAQPLPAPQTALAAPVSSSACVAPPASSSSARQRAVRPSASRSVIARLSSCKSRRSDARASDGSPPADAHKRTAAWTLGSDSTNAIRSEPDQNITWHCTTVRFTSDRATLRVRTLRTPLQRTWVCS